MKCVDCQDVLTEYALDSLGPRESEQVAEHLAGGCTDCRQYLDVVRAEWSALADTLQPAPPPAHVKAELLARIRAESSRSSIRRQHVFSPEPEPVTISRDGQSQQSGMALAIDVAVHCRNTLRNCTRFLVRAQRHI